MEMRIENRETLASHGNRQGREAMLDILEAGLEAADPYHNTRKLIRLEDGKLVIGGKDFGERDSETAVSKI